MTIFEKSQGPLHQILPLIEATNSFVIYGDDILIATVTTYLKKQGKFVRGFSACNFPDITDLPIKTYTGDGNILIIASFEELLLAKRISEVSSLLINKDYILMSHIGYAELGMYDLCGDLFTSHLEQYSQKFIECRKVLSDSASKDIYDKIIYLRKTSFCPIELEPDKLPVDPLIHREYSKKAQHVITQLPEAMPNTLRKAIAYKIAISPYIYKNRVYPCENAVILNCGAHNGSSSGMFSVLYPTSTVYGFEPVLSEWKMHCNLELFFPNVKSINMGVWSETTKVQFETAGDGLSGTSASRIGKGDNWVDVVSIDEFVSKQKLASVEYIKMDVEGAEMEALAGSEILLKDRKPDLAIAIYHKARHLWEIPLFLKDIVPEYNIYIDHKYGAADESICFATVRS